MASQDVFRRVTILQVTAFPHSPAPIVALNDLITNISPYECHVVMQRICSRQSEHFCVKGRATTLIKSKLPESNKTALNVLEISIFLSS